MTSISAVSYSFISIRLFFRDFNIFQKSQKRHTIACGPRSCTVVFLRFHWTTTNTAQTSGSWTRAHKLTGTTFIQGATVAAWWAHKMPNRKLQEHQRLASIVFFIIFREMSKTSEIDVIFLYKWCYSKPNENWPTTSTCPCWLSGFGSRQ